LARKPSIPNHPQFIAHAFGHPLVVAGQEQVFDAILFQHPYRFGRLLPYLVAHGDVADWLVIHKHINHGFNALFCRAGRHLYVELL
jgi:hypothetical protein